MKIITETAQAGPRVVALGTFDGVHRGHQALIREGRRLAEETGALLRVCTFDRHPLEVLRPERAPRMLETPEEQAANMDALGVDELRVIPFTRDTADTPPEEFLRRLRAECDLRAVVVGWNYSFGRQGAGNPEMLIRDGAEHGYQVVVVPSVKDEKGEVISSTAIRNKLQVGDLEGANRMLGYDYALSGLVVNGKHEGTRIGFPTANIETDGRKQLPAYGVYACWMESGGQRWPAVVNIGLQPTLPSGKVTVEAHALDVEVDLYGQEAKVSLKKYLRGETKFDNVSQLIHQIAQDKEDARCFLAEKG
ncbi:MAG: bifunctional riboflavin kinase/FAD synthetase [Clostridia bacterium]|nr:bifunctional riboflavin kinase/FAD synthetase [Clostridia bacterium]